MKSDAILLAYLIVNCGFSHAYVLRIISKALGSFTFPPSIWLSGKTCRQHLSFKLADKRVIFRKTDCAILHQKIPTELGRSSYLKFLEEGLCAISTLRTLDYMRAHCRTDHVDILMRTFDGPLRHPLSCFINNPWGNSFSTLIPPWTTNAL